MKLYQICNLLQRRGDDKDILFRSNCDNKSADNLQKMFDGFTKGDFRSDEEAIKVLFDKDPESRSFFDIKAKFREQLLKNLFHLNFNNSKFHYYLREELKCEVSLLQAKILLRNSLKQNAVWQFKRTLRIAESFHFTSVMKECIRYLKNQAVYTGDVNKFEKYRKKWLELIEVEKAEEEAEDLFAAIRVRSQKSVKELSNSKKLNSYALNRISELRKKHETPFLVQIHLSVMDAMNLRNSNWEGTLNLVKEIEENYEKNPTKYAAIRPKFFYISKSYALIMLNRIDEGLDYLKSILPEFRGDEVGYFIIMEDYFLMLMRKGQYSQALDLVKETISNRHFENNSVFTKERWEIYGEYAMFFAGERSTHDISLINYFPNYSKDKIGFNLQIIILQIFILIRDGKEDTLFNHIENLRYYEIRQISKSDNRRAQYFMRLLRTVTKQSLDYTKCKKQGNKYLNLLKKFPEKDQPYAEVEIIPYEKLWEYMLKLLSKKSVEKSEVEIA